MLKKTIFIVSALLAAATMSCDKSGYTPQPVAPLYIAAGHYDELGQAAIDSSLVAYAPEWRAFFSIVDSGVSDTVALASWSKSVPVRIFSPATDSVYPDTRVLEDALGAILYNAGRQGLELPQRRYAAVVWGRMQSMVFVDSVMLIALNHYLGEDYQGYHNRHFPAYLHIEKTPANLPYDLVEALVATQYPYQGGDGATALSRMLYEGALIEAKMRLVPDATLAGALGYNQGQLDWLEANSGQVWNLLVQKKLLYDTSAEVASRLVDRGVGTTILAPYVPARAGRFVGYSIITSYLEQNTAATLAQLLSPAFYKDQGILIESAYSGD